MVGRSDCFASALHISMHVLGPVENEGAGSAISCRPSDVPAAGGHLCDDEHVRRGRGQVGEALAGGRVAGPADGGEAGRGLAPKAVQQQRRVLRRQQPPQLAPAHIHRPAPSPPRPQETSKQVAVHFCPSAGLSNSLQLFNRKSQHAPLQQGLFGAKQDTPATERAMTAQGRRARQLYERSTSACSGVCEPAGPRYRKR